jgi:hypothetical protein
VSLNKMENDSAYYNAYQQPGRTSICTFEGSFTLCLRAYVFATLEGLSPTFCNELNTTSVAFHVLILLHLIRLLFLLPV